MVTTHALPVHAGRSAAHGLDQADPVAGYLAGVGLAAAAKRSRRAGRCRSRRAGARVRAGRRWG
jgi:hypothetical protein